MRIFCLNCLYETPPRHPLTVNEYYWQYKQQQQQPMHRKKCTRMAQCRIKMHKLLIRDCLNLIYFYAFLSLTRYLWVTLVVVMVSCKGREPWGIHSSSVMDNQQDIHCCNQQTTGPTLWLAGCLSVCTSINLRTNQTELLHEGLSLYPLLHSVPTDPQSVCPLQSNQSHHNHQSLLAYFMTIRTEFGHFTGHDFRTVR